MLGLMQYPQRLGLFSRNSQICGSSATYRSTVPLFKSSNQMFYASQSILRPLSRTVGTQSYKIYSDCSLVSFGHSAWCVYGPRCSTCECKVPRRGAWTPRTPRSTYVYRDTVLRSSSAAPRLGCSSLGAGLKISCGLI